MKLFKFFKKKPRKQKEQQYSESEHLEREIRSKRKRTGRHFIRHLNA